ncbi:hypothetical protein ACFRR6_01850 [Streptomyces sp. NPDC056891]|uniref:hypothetical protein n=1 Tax=Streptomyces sp. NPDC056891 TaxID=3345961 RepID=UPI00369F6C2A
MTTPVSRSHTVTARIDTDTTPTPAALDSTPMARAAVPASVMSAEEYQRRTLEELADDLIVDGVAYSRAEWEAAEDGVHRTTTIEDGPDHARPEEDVPAAGRASSVWNGTDAPF